MRVFKYNAFRGHIAAPASAFFLLLVWLFCSFFFRPDAALATTHLKVGIYNNPPIVFVDDNGTPQGVYVDTLNAIAAQEDWKLDYVYGPWSELLEKIQKGEIDVLTAIAYSAERDAYLDFNQEAFAERWGVLFVPAGSSIKTMSDLAGKRIALAVKDIHGGIFRQVVDLIGVDIETTEVSGYEAVFEKLRNKEADAGVVSNGYGFSHAEAYGLVPTPLTFKPTRLVTAFTEGKHQEISSTIDTYLKKWKTDPQSPYRLSHRRWLGAPRGEERNLSLSQQEMDWLARHKSIQVAFDGYFPPYSILKDDGKFEGLAVDIMQVLFERIGLAIEYSPKAVWKDLYEAAKKHEVDVVATMGIQPEREEWFAFTRPYIFKFLVIMTRSDDTAIAQPEDLAGKQVALVKNYQYVMTLLEKYPSIKPYYVDTMLDGLNAVATGQADAAITFLGAGHYLKAKYQITNLKFAAVYDRNRFTDSIAVRKDWPELASILDKALESVSSQEMISLQNKWLPAEDIGTKKVVLTSHEKAWIRDHPVIRVGIDPESAPFEFRDKEGKHVGISADYLHMLQDRLGINFQVVTGLNWSEVMEKARNREIDLLACIGRTSEREEYLEYSNTYINSRRMIITRSDAPFISGLEDIVKWKVAVQADSSHEGYLKENSAIRPVLVPTVKDGLVALSGGKVDAFVNNIGSTSHWTRELSLTNLKVAAPVSEGRLHIAVRKDWPLLVGIINKGLETVTAEEKAGISQRWIALEYNTGISQITVFKYLVVILLVVLLVIAGFTIFTRTLKKEVLRKTAQLQKELEERKRAELELGKYRDHLEELVKESTSDLKDSQAALMNIVEDLSEKTAELEAANERLKELDRLKSMFIASMSHELRTPLNSIIGFTGIILKGMTGEINAEQRDQLERVFRAGKHLLSLITDVIDISKIEAGKMAPFAGEFLLEDVIDEALDGVRKQAQDQGLDLEKQVPEKSVRMYTDRRMLLQCLLNFLSNAVKFTEKGFIKLSASEENGSVRISVSDSGIGIKPENMQFLFISFVRLESHLRTTRPGTGLGLYLTKKIATEVLGGDVFARSTEHVGSTFTIVIPKHLTIGNRHAQLAINNG